MKIKTKEELRELSPDERQAYKKIEKKDELTQGFCASCGEEGDFDYCDDHPNCYYS